MLACICYPVSARDKRYLYDSVSILSLWFVYACCEIYRYLMLLLIWGEIFRFHFRSTGVKGVCRFTIFGSDWPCSENAIKRVMQKQVSRS